MTAARATVVIDGAMRKRTFVFGLVSLLALALPAAADPALTRPTVTVPRGPRPLAVKGGSGAGARRKLHVATSGTTMAQSTAMAARVGIGMEGEKATLQRTLRGGAGPSGERDGGPAHENGGT